MEGRGNCASWRRWSGICWSRLCLWPPVADMLSGCAFFCKCQLLQSVGRTLVAAHSFKNDCVCQLTGGCILISGKAHTWRYLLRLCNHTVYKGIDSISREKRLNWPNHSSSISLIAATACFLRCNRLPHSQ